MMNKNKIYRVPILFIILLGIVSLIYISPKIYRRYSAYKSRKEWRTNFPQTFKYVNKLPSPDSLYIFFMAGQSNMAGRGFIEPLDTISNERILTIDKTNKWIYAKEPLHFYEPSMTGLDCGMSFAKRILDSIPKGIKVAIIPCAVGGSSIQQWINDSTFRGVKLLSNFKEKVEIGEKYGTIKGILWHQGENDAINEENIVLYQQRLSILFEKFRQLASNDKLPIIIGELGSFSSENEKWQRINSTIHKYTKEIYFSEYINTQDFNHRGDGIHFDSKGQREMGKRFAEKYFELRMPAYNTRYEKLPGH